MPATAQSILNAARVEWEFWGKSTWNLVKSTKAIQHTDDEIQYAQYVVDKYCFVGGGSPSLSDIADDRYYWSAVGMSAIMKNAGYTKNEFPFAQSHSRFIRKFVAARKSGDLSAPYWGYRFNEVGGEPEPGDIVAYARTKGITATGAAKLFDATSSYDSHTDVVVAKRKGEIDVIGCNVLDSVTKKTLRINSQGHIEDSSHFWFATLKRLQ
jgi:hypothetical protein